MLSKKEFNELKQLTYIQYLCNRVIQLHTEASGSCFNKNTNELEAIYLYLAKQINAKCIEDVSNYIKNTTGTEVFEGWISPVFAMNFEN